MSDYESFIVFFYNIVSWTAEAQKGRTQATLYHFLQQPLLTFRLNQEQFYSNRIGSKCVLIYINWFVFILPMQIGVPM